MIERFRRFWCNAFHQQWVMVVYAGDYGVETQCTKCGRGYVRKP